MQAPEDAAFLGMDLGAWVGTILGLLGLLAGYWFYKLAKKKNTLDYVFTDRQRLISNTTFPDLVIDTRFPGDLPESAQESLVNPRIYRVAVVNTGTESIDEGSFKEPVRVFLDEGVSGRIVEVAVVAASHPQMLPKGRIQKAYWRDPFVITPRLMNAGDGFVMQVLTEGTDAFPTVDSWRSGQDREMCCINIPPRRNRRVRLLRLMTYVLAFAGVVGILALLASQVLEHQWVIIPMIAVPLTLGVLLPRITGWGTSRVMNIEDERVSLGIVAANMQLRDRDR